MSDTRRVTEDSNRFGGKHLRNRARTRRTRREDEDQLREDMTTYFLSDQIARRLGI